MRKSARIAAHAAAKEYAKHERDQAYKTRESNSGLYFSFDESKHPRDENGRWTATPESNANLIKRTVKKPTSLKTHIASGAIVGAAIGTVNAPGIGSAIGAATGGALAATRKLTLKRTFEKANHRALQESMLKSLAGHGDVKGILKDNFKHHQFLKEASKIAVKDNETRSKLRTYISFHQATHDEKQKAIETNTLHELKPKKMLDMF